MFKRRPRRIILPREGAARRWSRSRQPAERVVRVAAIHRETPVALTLVLETDDGRALPFHAGQYLTHCFEIDGVVERRAYSLSSAEGGALACTIRVLPEGRVSQYVATRLKPGDRYRVLGPGGDFVLDAGYRGPLVLLAAGSGITPIISLIETALARDASRSVRLLHLAPDAGHAIFRERLRELARRHPSFELIEHHTRASGRPDAARLAAMLQPQADARVYLCGPQALMDLAEAGLRAAGFDATRILRERFVAAPRHLPRPTEPQPILFQRSQRTVEQQPGESILDAGLRAGIRLDFSCTVGGCGHCRLRVVEGELRLDEPNCLSPQERAAGYTLACSACATTALTVDA